MLHLRAEGPLLLLLLLCWASPWARQQQSKRVNKMGVNNFFMVGDAESSELNSLPDRQDLNQDVVVTS